MTDWARVPKVELHLHLEGAIPHETLWELVRKYGDPSVPDLAALRRRFEYRDFPHFLDTWVWKNGFLREYEDFTLIARAVAEDLRRQRIRYAEAFFSPGDFARHGLRTQPLVAAIRAGLSSVEGVEVALIADLVRDYGPERGARTLSEVHEARALGVVGIGIGGSEHAFPPEPFAPVYAEARRLGFRTSAHAGEAAGPESVRGALEALRVDRVGHAVRAQEDPALLDELRRRRVALELCPVSNLRTGVVGRIEDHPVRRYFDEGLLVTLNTDDPKMFGNDLAGEYALLQSALGFSEAELGRLILNGVEASWLPEERKKALRAELEADEAWPLTASRSRG